MLNTKQIKPQIMTYYLHIGKVYTKQLGYIENTENKYCSCIQEYDKYFRQLFADCKASFVFCRASIVTTPLSH